MERTNLDHVAAKRHVEDAQAGLRQLDTLAAASGASLPGGVVRGAVAAAMVQLDDVVRLLATSTEDMDRVACPRCGRMVMSSATRCGFCWHILSPRAAQ